MLTSQAREVLRGVEHVIVDEVHAIAGSKRGAHLALCLERLEQLVAAREGATPPQRIGLSAHPAAARADRPVPRRRRRRTATVTIVDAGGTQAARPPGHRPDRGHDEARRAAAARPAARRPGGGPGGARQHLAGDPPRILELIRAHRSTIVFTNSRRLGERLAQRLNELAGEELVRAHHGIDRPRAADRDRGGPEGRPAAGASSRRAASSSASTWARSTSSSRSRARPRSRAACSGSVGPATRSARRARA